MLWCYSLPMFSGLSPSGSGSRPKLTPFSRALLVSCAAALSVACGGDEGDDKPAPPPPVPATIVITDAEQYTSEADLDIPVVQTAPTNITIDWSGVTKDLQCHDVAANGIVNASFLKFPGMTQAEVEAELTKSSFDSSKAEYWDHRVLAGETSAKLDTYEQLGGDPIDIDSDFVVSSEDTYLAIVQDTTGLGIGTKSMSFVVPVAGGGNTVTIGTGCPTPPILKFTAHLNKPKISFPSDGKWIVSWADVTKDGTGGEIALNGVDGLLLGFYPGMDVADLEADFFDIEELANPMYELEVEGSDLEADLSEAHQRTASGAEGPQFAGFDQAGEGTWLVALTCRVCPNPQPVILAILDPS
jgi:hypothetical protein